MVLIISKRKEEKQIRKTKQYKNNNKKIEKNSYTSGNKIKCLATSSTIANLIILFPKHNIQF